MNKLKNITLVPEGDSFQVIGNYKVVGETRFDDNDYKTIVMYESANYFEALREARVLSKACPCGMFDLVKLNASVPLESESLEESFAKMRKV